ncbi:hypothetical protein PF66_06192 [Pseudomonas asplenii]|uniref:Uncharacterized protein n=1 Tax=Pseudomonas asplenii TaxID=53407 RepID=A0A0M9GBW0_9PSED|nr:hypothetical protein [Pseudomonas fuscovaginae]KPA87282.1 hypothetical protein PF66_06192 [Pseudomonas fuscovaginae]
MTFLKRDIDVSFKLQKGGFGSGFEDTATYSGLRCEVSVNNVSGASLNSLQMRVYGMQESSMNKLSTLGVSVMETDRNIITVTASNSFGGMTQVFQGTIVKAWIDYRGAPEVSLNVEAAAGYYEQVKAVGVNSYKGSTDVATIIESLAKSIDFAFTNNGVSAKLDSPYLAGSAITQIKSCAQHAGIAYDISNGSVQIWPSGESKDDVSLMLSPETGLVGYPVFSNIGIDVQSEFNADISLGRRIQVRSSIPQACGDEWFCKVVRHELASQVVNGPWFTYAQLAKKGWYVAK